MHVWLALRPVRERCTHGLVATRHGRAQRADYEVKQAVGDLWEIGEDADAVVITTNGTLKHNHHAVMGRGCAREAATKFPGLPKQLGQEIFGHGNVVHTFLMPSEKFALVAFPVKHEWWQKADVELIAASTISLIDEADENKWQTVVMPRPGCGNGGLSWWSIEPMLQEALDDRFTVVSHG